MATSSFAEPASVETETRLLLPDGTALGPGDVGVTGGVGIVLGRNAAGALTVDGSPFDKQLPRSLFLPGPLAAGTSMTWPNPSPEPRVVVEQLVANLLTDAAASATDHHAVRLAGSIAGQVDLALDGTGPSYSFDAASTNPLGEQSDTVGGAQSGLIVGSYFKPTADLTVTAIEFGLDPDSLSDEFDAKAYLLDAGRTTILGETHVYRYIPESTGANVRTPIMSLTESVDLAQDTTYAVAIEDVSEELMGRSADVKGEPPEYIMAQWSNAALTGSLAGSSATDTGTAGVESFAIAPDSTEVESHHDPTLDADNVHTAGYRYPFWLYGDPTGVALEGGQVTASIVAVGAGPTTPGEDLNLHAMLAGDVA